MKIVIVSDRKGATSKWIFGNKRTVLIDPNSAYKETVKIMKKENMKPDFILFTGIFKSQHKSYINLNPNSQIFVNDNSFLNYNVVPSGFDFKVIPKMNDGEAMFKIGKFYFRFIDHCNSIRVDLNVQKKRLSFIPNVAFPPKACFWNLEKNDVIYIEMNFRKVNDGDPVYLPYDNLRDSCLKSEHTDMIFLEYFVNKGEFDFHRTIKTAKNTYNGEYKKIALEDKFQNDEIYYLRETSKETPNTNHIILKYRELFLKSMRKE